jgi:hypothetical protein
MFCGSDGFDVEEADDKAPDVLGWVKTEVRAGKGDKAQPDNQNPGIADNRINRNLDMILCCLNVA